jgi:methionyl-tRNA formyltransferase
LREFAAQHDIEYFPHFADFRDWSETIAHDYLFSILNFKILPASMLDAPNICAINYHDAPLPKYAGSHACAWALANRETTHGISWHVMTPEVDGGDILKQATFPIAPDDTLDRLHQKCFLSAMRAFRSLLPDLNAETFTRAPQDLSQRTYYPKASLPAPNQ